MEWTNLMLILGLVILISYSVFSGLLIGRLPVSLSETYYELKRVRKGWIFVLTLLVTAMTLLPIWLDRTSESWYQFAVFLACSATIFVAFSPNYKFGIERKVHYISAYIAGVSVVLYHIFNGTLLILMICLLPTILGCFWKRNSVSLFAELSIISSVYLSLIQN